MKFYRVLTMLLTVSTAALAYGQGDIEVSGFFQARSGYQGNKLKMTADVPTPGGIMSMTLQDLDKTTYYNEVQQLNLFFRKELSSEFSAWVNLELINTFSTERGWGAMNLEEAWLKYEKNARFIIKAGLLIPKFNRLNEIKNRMPLLPYITRPLVYEASIRSLADLTAFLPERSLLQVYGTLPAGDKEFEYAVHLDYAEKEYFASETAQTFNAPGRDTSEFAIKGIGGRLGANVGNFSLGISGTWDRDNSQATLSEDVPRIRMGSDLTYTTAKVFFEGELIYVKMNPEADVDMNKIFYYATLGYNITDKFYGYSSYSILKDEELFGSDSAPLKSLTFGLGYRPIFPVHLKLQAGNSWTNGDFDVVVDPSLPAMPGKIDLSLPSVSVAVSVLF